jgi:glutamate/tyrosine decarboxylase-like PLP-dependent enzyme
VKSNPAPALQLAYEAACKYLSSLSDESVKATASLDDLRRRLSMPMPVVGMPPDQVIRELIEGTADGHLRSASGRFFAWVIGGALESATAADWLASTWDENAALAASAPAAAIVEEVAGQWLKQMLELPIEASFAFTTGCQMAHFVCLSAARYAVLKKVSWDVHAEGLCGAPVIRVIVSDQRHVSVDRALRFLGIGSKQITQIETDRDGRMKSEDFEASLLDQAVPTIVVLNAGDLNIGAFDLFEALIPISKRAGAWVHIDGAFGLFAQASRQHKHRTAGIELADSWATDGHKWLNVPFDCGVAFVRDREAHRSSMSIDASYIFPQSNVRDQIHWNPEWSRRARGYAVYAALRELGAEGIEQLIDRCCEHARELVDGIGDLCGVEVLWRPTLNQGLVRFVDPASTSPLDDDRFTDRVIAKINETGEAFFSGTTWRGQRAMRISVVNWRTNPDDILRSIAAVKRSLESLSNK